MKNLIKGVIVALGLLTTSAHAIPTLSFDGEMSYTTDGLLTVDSVLTASEDIASTLGLVGSSFDFSVMFTEVDVSNGLFTVGRFGSTAGTDLTVKDGNNVELLTGDFDLFEMKGGNGFDSGLITGSFNATSGSLLSEFGLGHLVALEFNMNTTFSADMFKDNFNSRIDGRISGETVGVPEPSVLSLLAISLLFLGLKSRRKLLVGSAANI